MISSILFFVLWVIMLYVVCTQAKQQGRNVLVWLAFGLVITPVVPAAILWFLGRKA